MSDPNDLIDLLDVLDEREQSIIKYRFGIGGSKSFTLKQVGKKFGVSPTRISQIQYMALRKIRKSLASA